MQKNLLFLLLLISSSTYSQNLKVDPQMIKMGWTFASPFILKKINDPLTKEIIVNTVPKIIDQDVHGAVLEISNAIYKVKNVKVLNKEFLAELEKNVNDGIKAIKQQDYAGVVNALVKSVAFTETYLKKGILDIPESTTHVDPAPIVASNTDIVTRKEINGKLFLSTENDYLFFIPNGSFEQINSSVSNQSVKGSETDFHVKLDSTKNFDMGVAKVVNQDYQQMSIERIQNDNGTVDKLKQGMATMFKQMLGDGEIIKSEVATYPNFKALKYTYLYTDKNTSSSAMAYTLLTFQDTKMYLIYFSTSTNYFLETSKAFDNLMNTFFIVGIDEISNSNMKSYSKAVLTRITINKILPKKSTGETWDNAFANYYPDIYYIITDKNGQTLRKLPEAQRKEDVKQLPVSFSLMGNSFTIDNLKETFWIFLYDFDSVTDPDKVGSVGFNLSDYMFGKDAYPEEITKMNNGTQISLIIKWE